MGRSIRLAWFCTSGIDLGFSVFSYLLVPLGFVTNEFFPKSENDYVYVNLELPSGTNTSTATISTQKLLEKLRKTEGVEYVSAEIGKGINAGAQDFKSGNNLALLPAEC